MQQHQTNPRLSPEGLQEILSIYFGQETPTTNQLIHLFDRMGWWGHSLDFRQQQLKRTILLEALRNIRDDEGYRIVHILGDRGRERIVQEELFTGLKDYALAVKNYYQDRRDDDAAAERLKKNCWRRYGLEIPSYEAFLENPEDPLWRDD